MKKTRMLKKNYEFKNVLNRGKSYSGKYIYAFVKPNYKNINFLGIAISVKLGKAVKRNYIKRIIRENYKNLEVQIKTGYDIVFLWQKQKQIKDANYSLIEQDMNNIFSKAELFL